MRNFIKVVKRLSLFAVVGLAAFCAQQFFGAGVALAAENNCSNIPYVSVSNVGITQLNRLGLADGSLTPIGPPLAQNYNAMDYNPDDGLLYASPAATPDNLLLIRPETGLVVTTLPVLGLPADLNAATINRAGTLYYAKSQTDDLHIYVVDVDNASGSYGQLLSTINLSSAFDAGDFIIHPQDNKAYGVTPTGDVLRVNLTTGAVTTIATTNMTQNFGGQTVDILGNMYLYSNDTGQIHRLDLTELDGTGNAIVGSHSLVSNSNNTGTDIDAAGCLFSIDYGDAPNSYGTFESSNGASHLIIPELSLGSSVTAEPDADRRNPLNFLNDSADNALTSPPSLSYNMTSYQVNVSLVNASGTAVTLAGWVDFNGNGMFDANERATATVPNGSTQATLSWTGISPHAGASALRLRLFSSVLADPQPVGADVDGGEVEDYALQIAGPPIVSPTLPNTGQNTLLPLAAAAILVVGGLGIRVVQSRYSN